MKKPVILIVDVEKILSDSLKTELKGSLRDNYRIKTAENADESFDIVEESIINKIDLPLIITDIKGNEFLKIIHESIPHTLIIMLTGQADIQAVSNAINNSNLYRFFLKPWNKDEIILTCQEAIKSFFKSKEKKIKTKEVIELNTQLEFEVEKLTVLLKEKNDELLFLNEKVQNLADNSDLGFLSFSNNFIIDQGVSAKSNKIFGKEIVGMNILDLISSNVSNRELHEKVIKDLFTISDDSIRSIYLRLLPKEVLIHDKFIEISYKMINGTKINNPSIMMILHDITEKKALNFQIQEEHNNLIQAIFALNNSSDIIDYVNDYRNFLNIELEKILQLIDRVKSFKLIYRQIHTYKGLFSQINFNHTADKLHEIETQLSQFKKENKPFEDILGILNIDLIIGVLNHDLDKLFILLGKDIFDKKYDTLEIQKSRLFVLENEILNKLPLNFAQFSYEEIQKLKYINFKDYLTFYISYVDTFSQKVEKPIYPLLIYGDDILVDPFYYKSFIKTIIHIFRNAIDHGIEDPEERLLTGKDEMATIKCQIKDDTTDFYLIISDDGRGIDPAIVLKKLIENGIVEKNKHLTDKEIFQYLFLDEFTTKDEVSEISGRGIGLSAVYHDLEKIQAEISIESKIGVGTDVIIKLKKEIKNYDNIQIQSNLFENLLQFTKDYFYNDFNIELIEHNQTKLTNSIITHQFSAFFSLSGMLRGLLIISFNLELMTLIKKSLDIINEDEYNWHFNDIFSEISNVIIGRAISNLPNHWQMINFSTPLIVLTKSKINVLEEVKIINGSLHFENSELSFSLYTGN